MSTQSIRISTDNFDNLLWCATRYCIGRRSYVSSYAQDFWRIINSNRDKLSGKRLESFARDIRAEASNCVGMYYDNVRVRNACNDRIVFDAFSLIASHVSENRNLEGSETFYDVDCMTGEVAASQWPLEGRRPQSAPFSASNERDMVYWLMLANCIDRQYKVTVRHNGKEQSELFVKHPAIPDLFVSVSNWSMSVCGEFIVSAKPLFII